MAREVEINQDTRVKFNGKIHTIEQFRDMYQPNATIEEALQATALLLQKGKMVIADERTKVEKVFSKALSEEEWKAAAEQHMVFEEQHLDYKAEQKREGRSIYEEIEVPFSNLLKAQEFQANIVQRLRIKETEIKLRPGEVILIFFNVTDSELNYIKRLHSADRYVDTAVSTVGKGAKLATDLTHFTATKVISPVVQVAARSSVSILRTLLTTGAKTAGSFITAASQGIKEAAFEIRHDPDVLKAGRELIQTKDSITRTVSGFSNGSNSGNIRIVR